MKRTPKDELMAVLDDEHADAVLEYRRVTKKAPLTAHAAKLLARRLAEYGDANEAADIMIESCWQGFKAEWVGGRRNAPAHETDLQRMSREMRNGRQRDDYRGYSEVVPLFSGQR